MKKRTTVLVLTIALTLVLGAYQSVFAGIGPATQATKDAIANAGVQSVQVITNEVKAESFCYNLVNEVAEGGYDLVNTEDVKAMVDNKEDVLIIDTMGPGWWAAHHVPNSYPVLVGGNGKGGAPKYVILDNEKEELLNVVKSYSGTKKVTKWYNKKTKKWTTKKPAKKYRGKSKKVTVDVKDAKIVVYCGFTGCARSHQAAMYLTSMGYTNVSRYAGGIAAWVDAGYDIEGSDIAD